MTPASGYRLHLVSHDASLSGAPATLASFARWLRLHRPGRHDVVVLADGPRRSEFAAALPTALVGPSWNVGRRLGEATSRPATRRRIEAVAADVSSRALRSSDRDRRVPVWWANSLASLSWVAAAAPSDEAVVCHVHELDHTADRILPSLAVRRRLVRRVDRFVAASDAVAEMLTDRWQIAAEAVTVVDEFVDARPMRRSADIEAAAARPTIVGMGTISPRKGVDEFVEVVGEIRSERDISAVWVGAATHPADAATMTASINALGLGSVVDLVGELASPDDVLRSGSVLLVMSREDPAPLVALEAALVGVPVVGTRSGGLGALLDTASPALAVEVGDVVAAAVACRHLLDKPGEASALAARQRAVVQATRTTDHAGPLLWDAAVEAATVAAARRKGRR